MIDMLPLMLGAVGLVFAFLYIAFKLDEEHFGLKFLAFGFAILIMFLIPKVAMDQPYNCNMVLTNIEETYTYGNNFTGYHWDYDAGTAPSGPQAGAYLFHKNTTNTYDYVCGESKNTPLSMQRIIVGFLTVFLIYVLIYTFKWLFENLLRQKMP